VDTDNMASTKNELKPSKSKWTSAYNYLLNKDLLLSILVAVTIIILGFVWGWENNKIVPVSTNAFAHYTLEPSNPLSYMANWDGPDYLQIASTGYEHVNQSNFFPLYPLAIRSVNYLVKSPLYSALLISWVSLVGAVYFYLKIIKSIFSTKENLEALKAVLLFILFPTGVFLLAPYTESLLAFLALGSIYYALERKNILSGLLAMLATATHIDGVFIVILISLILIEQKEKILKAITAAIIGMIGLIAYALFLLKHFDKPFAFISAQKSHGWLEHGYSNFFASIDLFNVIFMILLIISIVYWWKRRKSFSVYSFLFLCIPIVGGQFGGFNRYVLMAFPIQFMIFDQSRNRKLLYPIVIAVFSVSWTYFLFQYAGGYIGG
jgi:Gpi18-like mannosyltransferase